MSAVASLACGFLPRSVPLRYPMALIGVFLTARDFADGRHSVVADRAISPLPCSALASAALLTLLPIAWADYFGRANFAAIRGVALSAQVLAQAAGPLLSGALHDWTGNYAFSLQCFAVLSGLSVVAALTARRPAALRPADILWKVNRRAETRTRYAFEAAEV